jgi:hypothetical protein
MAEDVTRLNLYHSRWDRRAFETEREQRSIVSQSITDLLAGDAEAERPGLDNAVELVQDLWGALYKVDPQLIGKHRVHTRGWPPAAHRRLTRPQ